jgi:hypothetical protein
MMKNELTILIEKAHAAAVKAEANGFEKTAKELNSIVRHLQENTVNNVPLSDSARPLRTIVPVT